MKIASAYSVHLRNFCRVFDDTVEVYRKAVDFFIEIMLRHRDPKFTELKHDNDCIRLAEGLNVVNKDIAVKTANFIVKLANEFFFIEIMLRHRDPKFTELKHDNDCIRLAEGLNVVNKDIAVKTANFIVKLANEFKVDVIVMEHRDLTGRKRGTKRQRLHHWRAKYV